MLMVDSNNYYSTPITFSLHINCVTTAEWKRVSSKPRVANTVKIWWGVITDAPCIYSTAVEVTRICRKSVISTLYTLWSNHR